jgi:hypothetical protein
MKLLILCLLLQAACGRPPPDIYQQGPHYKYQKGGSISLEDETATRQTLPNSRALQYNANIKTTNLADPSTRIRRDVLLNYDRGAYPWDFAWENSPTDKLEGVPVELNINFHKVYQVDITNSVVDLVVWVQQRWIDPRLTWDPAEYGNLTRAWFYVRDGSGSAGGASEIWTPDLELWNLETPLTKTLVDAHAAVNSDGTVYWSRPGHLRAVCKFEGLGDFPFDQLKCTLEIGSWVYSGLYIRAIKYGGTGFSIGGSDTAGEAFAEYSLHSVDCEEKLYPPYPIAPNEDWPVLFYHVTFSRAWQPYARGFLAMQILLNLIAFLCFWLPPQCGERLSLGISTIVAAVASELVVSSALPAASEVTWFSKFSLTSMTFASACLFESAVVIYFYYHTGDTLIPDWFTWLANKRIDSPQAEKPENVEKTNSSESAESDDLCRDFDLSLDFDLCRDFVVKESAHSISVELGNDLFLKSSSSKKASSSSNSGVSMAGLVATPAVDSVQTNSSKSIRREEHDKAIVVEKANSIEPQPRSIKSTSQEAFHEYTQGLSGSAKTQIDTILGRDMDDYKNVREMVNNHRWQRVGKSIDEISRILFPVAYAIFLAAMTF